MSLTSAQLPVRLTPLVGRESELDDIVQAVTRCRLVTLTGPGGAGKTRLALAAARSAGPSFAAGVCWVELAQIEDPALVGQAVASKLGVPDTPGQDPAGAVAEHIADHPVLVVLDNCEHVAGEAAKLVENLLAVCPALVVLATSREALGVEGEVNWQVPPLSLPKVGGSGPAPTASALAASDAVKLFEQRAQLVRPSFRVTDENAEKIASIESALLATGRFQAAAGRHQAAAVLFRRAVAHEPLNETAHRELMSSWARLGETARAIRHYEELTELLREQVGVPPAAETTALYQRLMAAS